MSGITGISNLYSQFQTTSVSGTSSVTNKTSGSAETGALSASGGVELGTATAMIAQGNKVTLDAIMDVFGEELGWDRSSSSGGMLDPIQMDAGFVAGGVAQALPEMFKNYAEENPDLSGEDLMSSFLEEVQSFLETAYGQAEDLLTSIGGGSSEDLTALFDASTGMINQVLEGFAQSVQGSSLSSS